jgi:uncharacterized sulfatase
MLSRRTLLGAFGAPALALQRKTAAPRLNVVFIGSDDLRNAMGCYGHPIVKTPNIDALAARGVRFDRAYCQFPLCGPSRTSLLSGLRPDSTRIWQNEIAIRETVPQALTLPQAFRQAGGRSVRFGKMYHMGVPTTVGTNRYDDPDSWDHAVSPPGLEDTTPGEGRNITPRYGRGNAMDWVSFDRRQEKNQADDAVAELGVEEISKASKPLFLALGFVRPHVPFVAPSRFFDLYPLDRMNVAQVPANDRDDIPMASEKTITGRGNDMGMNEQDKREALRGYYAAISYLDSQVGRVVEAVEKKGLMDRTAFVFWSDHGWHLGEHFRWQKRSLFEESARVPLIVTAPGRKRGGSKALVELVDMYPTVMELTGVPVPAHCEGQSLVPLLDNPSRTWKSAAFTQVWTSPDIMGRAIRTDRHRYIRWTGTLPKEGFPGADLAEELYDHQTDPQEMTNIAGRPESATVLAGLREKLDAGWKAAQAKV